MFEFGNENFCPRCRHLLKSWQELTSDEKFTVERLPASAEFSLEQRKQRRFCERCWFEEIYPKSVKA
ncbi:MAG: hypothetical protein ACR2GD_03255 [Pyrinomonadaceae bacterium]